MPEIQTWDPGLFSFFESLPGYLGCGIRLLQTEPVQDRVFVFHQPYSQETFLSLMNWADQVSLLLDVEGEAEVYNGFLPNGKKTMILFSPLIQGRVNHGEIIFVTRPLSPGLFKEWSLFCDHIALILLAKVLSGSRSLPAQRILDPDSSLDFLLELQQTRQPSNSPDQNRASPEERWLEEDIQYLYRVVSRFHSQFDLDTVFSIQKVAPGKAQIIILTWTSNLDAVHPKIREMIEDRLFDEGLGTLDQAQVRVFPMGQVPPDHQSREPSVYSLPCESETGRFGYLGVCMQRDVDWKSLYRLTALLANHLALRFANLYQLRQEEIFTLKLKQITSACNFLTVVTDLGEIFLLLKDHLARNFGQEDGAVLLMRPGSKLLEVSDPFGEKPEGFDLMSSIAPDEWICKQIQAGVASKTESEDGAPVRWVLPFSSVPQQLTHMMDVPPNQSQDDLSNRSLGGLILYNSPRNRWLEEKDEKLLKILLDRVTTSVQSSFQYQEKLGTIKWLEVLIDKVFGLTEDEILAEMVQIIRQMLKVNRVSILGLDTDGKHFRIRQAFGLPDDVILSARIPYGSEITGLVASQRRSMLVNNIEASVDIQKRSNEAYYNGSLLSVPLIPYGEDSETPVRMVINVNNKTDGLIFDEQDQKLLEAVAHLITVALTHQKLLRGMLEKERLDRQLIDAHEVWNAMLPKKFNEIPVSMRLWGASQAARSVGGDFYDFLPLGEGRWLLAMGDVSGKGMPAAILMATTRIILRTAVRDLTNPAEILAKVDALLCGEMDAYHMVTLLLVSFDPATGHGKFSSAGHGPLMVCRQGKVVEIRVLAGTPVGIGIPGTRYSSEDFSLSSGDSLVLYTDGLTEERSHYPDHEMFGVERIKKELTNSHKAEPREVAERLFALLESWRGARDAHDDVTIMAMKYLGNAP